MSLVETYRGAVARKMDDISRLTGQKAKEHKKIADLSGKIQSATRSMNLSSSSTTKQMKQREILRYQQEVAKTEGNIAEFERKLAQKNRELRADEKRLADEELREGKKIQKQQADFQKAQIGAMSRLSRSLENHEQEIRKLKEPSKEITVLFLAANPRDQVQLSLDEEVRSIHEMILKSKHRDSVKLESRWAVRPLDILQSLNELEPAIVHFSGHGTDSDELVLTDNQQNTKLVPIAAIVQAMSVASDCLQLVFFNTCFSENQARQIVEHVDFAIGMRTSISDVAARVFASQFYSSISFGLTVAKSFGQAKAALLLEGIAEEDTPELFCRDGVDPGDVQIVGNFG